jgi:5'(3')-deoxyribonucleotidase
MYPWMLPIFTIKSAKRDELTKQFEHERSANAELESQVSQDQRTLESLSSEYKVFVVTNSIDRYEGHRIQGK